MPTKVVPNIIVAISGEPKTGKSHWSLTFPAPIVVFSFDQGIEPVLKSFPDKKVTVKTYELPLIETVRALGQKKDILEVWNNFKKDFQIATEDASVKTIVIDTSTALYEIARIARTGELGRELDPTEYGDVYLRMKALFQRCRISGQNLVLTHYMKAVYKDGKETSEKKIDAFRYTESEVDLSLITEKVTEAKVGGGKQTKIVTTIKETRYDALNLTGFEFINGTYDDIVSVLGLDS